MPIKPSKRDVLRYIRGLDNIQLNKRYRKKYISDFKENLKLARQRNKAGVRTYTKKLINEWERHLKNLDRDYPVIEIKRIEINDH